METIFVVNMDERAFFRYTKKSETDKGYNKIMLKLLTPPKNTSESHWKKEDKIVVAPENTHNYLERLYNELIVS